jgi:Dyp-type peroxidase family
LAFSWQGLRKLTLEADAFEPLFKDGLSPLASFRLGDPIEENQPGHYSTWIVGKPGEAPDMLAILASDSLDALMSAVTAYLVVAKGAGIECAHYDIGHNTARHPSAPADFPAGREHFGFRDGVSQPGVRGRLSSLPSDFFTPRRLPSVTDPSSTQPEFSAPGQPLVCVGEFVLGYPRQNGNFGRRSSTPYKLGPEPFAPQSGAIAPYWARNGSFLVYRRLRQDVAGFNTFLQAEATRLAQQDEFSGLSAERLGAMLVGRWRSGAPFLRTPSMDCPKLAAQNGANNAFGFLEDHDPQDGFPKAAGDPEGLVCPQAAHIRKVNPRDLPTDQGPANSTLTHRILRRGIPFGAPLPLGAMSDPSGEERGLLFLCYQSSIREQFEFLTGTWMNDRSRPSPFSPPSGSGFDIISGQNPAPAEHRDRFCLIGAAGATVATPRGAGRQWIIPTGGGYFFTPSRSAIMSLQQQQF